jgi:carboxypeptidase family protein/TonB-dependent receptor-like protein
MRRILVVLASITLLSIAVWAQLPVATLNGIVTDPQGAVVPGAKVHVTDQATGESRDITASSDGSYSVPNLKPGDYTVNVEAGTFARKEFKNIHLDVGRAVTLDVALSTGSASQVITVSGGEQQLELTQSQVQGQIPAATLESIPLNGRNFLELAYLLPGNRPATNFDPTKTNTLEVSSAGQFGRGGNITVDGGDNNDEVVGGTLTNFPEDGIQQFQISTNRFTAEVGRSGSSIINILTKSGTNTPHGSAFLFFRHKTLQALPATFAAGQPTPPFVREQFGGSLGGPIIKDKAFWFTSAEYRNQGFAVPVGVRDFASNSITNGAASALLHDFLWTSRVDWDVTSKDKIGGRYSFERSLDISNGSLRRPAGTAANRQTSLNRYNSILGSWTRILSPNKVNDVIFHIDYFLNNIPAFSDNNPVTNPAGLAAGNEVRFPSLQDGANFRIPQRTRFDRYQIRETFSWVLGKHTLRLGGEWQNSGSDILFDIFGSGSVFTTEDFATQDRNGDAVIDDRDIPIAVVVKSAAPVRPPTAPKLRNNYWGLYAQDDWRALTNLTFNLGLRWEIDSAVLGDTSVNDACPEPLTTAPTSPCKWIRNILGPHDSPDKYHNFGPRVGFAWDPFKKGNTVVRGGYGIYYDRVVLEVPLLEDLLDGRIISLGASGGSVCSNVLNSDCSQPGALFDVGTPTLANPLVGAPSVFGIGVNVVDPKASTPFVQQYSLGVQQQAGKHWIFSVDGVSNRGRRFLIGRGLRSTTSTSSLITCPNGVDLCTVTDPLTGQANNVTLIQSIAKTWYDALLFSVAKKVSGRGDWKWGFNANYTLSKTLNIANDDQIPFNGAEDQVNLLFHTNNLNIEKGYSPTDERHRFVFFGLFNMPWQFEVSPIWTWSSSVPMDSLVPALSSRLPNIRRNALGRDIQNGTELNAAITAYNALPLCPPNGNTPGPVPCNGDPNDMRVTLPLVNPNLTFGDDFNSFDLRITKTFKLTERQQVKVISEVFNIVNQANIRGTNNNNFSGFVNDITSPTFNRPIGTAGQFFGAGGPRAFQFALRYSF